MPPLYGEGPRAFRRLQLEIMQNSNDHTLFAWNDSVCSGDMLASSPEQFAKRVTLQTTPYSEYVFRFDIASPKPDYGLTNAGLRIQLPMVPNPKVMGGYIAFLACTRADPVQRYVAVIYLERTETRSFNGFHRVAYQGRTTGEHRNPTYSNYETQTIWISKKVQHQLSWNPVPSRILTNLDALAGVNPVSNQNKRRSGIGDVWGSLRRRSTIILTKGGVAESGRAKKGD